MTSKSIDIFYEVMVMRWQFSQRLNGKRNKI